MRLAEWRKREGKTQAWLADQLDVSQPYISAIERADNNLVPGKALAEKIFMLSEGAVEPNDFHDMPRWRQLLSAALSLMRRKAA